MRVLLAGANGAIGRLLVPMLLEAGHEVVGTSRSDAGLAAITAAGADAVRLDVFDRESTLRALAAARPEAVIHQLTALGERRFDENARIRREGTRNLVDGALKAGVGRIVAQSISWVYAAGDKPATEDEPLDLAREGLVGPAMALESAAAEIERHVVLRYGLLYGPGTWYFPGEWAADQLREGQLKAGAAVSSFVHVADAARAALLALEWPDGVVNVVDDEPAPAREWVPVLASALGEPAPPVTTGPSEIPPAGAGAAVGREGWERGASNAKARALGWTPAWPTWRTGFPALAAES
ncbi:MULTISPECIES: NAD-dependent epimerase/dehydratase family protein [Nonomuraea]|uniref:NAD-dependent epimerase/dehydratase family protein n=1 Tax=Nonomuraea mangrovi TaxID=2316207 RepID=A0ABW4SQU7_9ACTN